MTIRRHRCSFAWKKGLHDPWQNRTINLAKCHRRSTPLVLMMLTSQILPLVHRRSTILFVVVPGSARPSPQLIPTGRCALEDPTINPDPNSHAPFGDTVSNRCLRLILGDGRTGDSNAEWSCSNANRRRLSLSFMLSFLGGGSSPRRSDKDIIGNPALCPRAASVIVAT